MGAKKESIVNIFVHVELENGKVHRVGATWDELATFLQHLTNKNGALVLHDEPEDFTVKDLKVLEEIDDSEIQEAAEKYNKQEEERRSEKGNGQSGGFFQFGKFEC